MGLDTTHDCWHGAYSAFNRWREKLAEVSGIPLTLMEGYYVVQISFSGENETPLGQIAQMLEKTPVNFFGTTLLKYDKFLPIKWDALKPDTLHVLLDHSDCDGDIPAEVCAPLADRLEELLLLMEGDGGGHVGDYRVATEKFIAGLRLAASQGEAVEFH